MIRQKLLRVARLRWKNFVRQGTTQYATQQDDVERIAPSDGRYGERIFPLEVS